MSPVSTETLHALQEIRPFRGSSVHEIQEFVAALAHLGYAVVSVSEVECDIGRPTTLTKRLRMWGA